MFIYQQNLLFQNSGSTLIGWKLREIKPPMDRQSYISTICLAQRIKLILSFFEYEEEHFSLHTVELCLRPAGTNKLQCLQEAVLRGNMICRYYLKSGYYSRGGPKRDFTVSTLGVPTMSRILTGDSEKLSFSTLTKVPFLIF